MSKIIFKSPIFKSYGFNMPDDLKGVLTCEEGDFYVKPFGNFTLYDDGTMVFDCPDKAIIEKHIQEQMNFFGSMAPGALPKKHCEDYIYAHKPVYPGDEEYLQAIKENVPEEYRLEDYSDWTSVNSIEDVERIKREWEEKQQKEKEKKRS